MSELSNDVPVQHEPLDNEQSTTSTKTMVITLSLLIIGLMLTGSMMLHYATTNGNKTADDAAEPTQSVLSMTSLLKKTSGPVSPENPTAISTPPPQSGPSGLTKLFGSKPSSVRWPKMRLTGFGTSTERTESFAIINDHQYHEGQMIDGKVLLQEVRDYDVLVVYMGETNTLSVNVKN